MVALYAFALSFFFELTRTQYALLFVIFAMMMGAELFDTVAGEVSDMLASSFHPVVRIIRSLAASAVLVFTGFVVEVGLYLSWWPVVLLLIVWLFLYDPLYLCMLALVTAAGVVYILLGPIGIRDTLRRNKNKKSNQK